MHEKTMTVRRASCDIDLMLRSYKVTNVVPTRVTDTQVYDAIPQNIT